MARVSKTGSAKLARPCAGCEVLLKKAGVKTVVYTTDDGYEIEEW